MPAVYCEIIKYAIGTQAASEFTLFGQVYDLEAACRMGVVQKNDGTGPASGCCCRLGRSRQASLLSGLFTFQARPAGNDDGCNRFGYATRSGLVIPRHVGPQESARKRTSLPAVEG
jgi:hypothetical protein